MKGSDFKLFILHPVSVLFDGLEKKVFAFERVTN